MSSSIIVDTTGPADLSFNGIPLRTLKNMKFTTKLGTAYNLLKMIINGITYNVEETSQNGAVVFSSDYGGWVFVAPDDRLDFDSYTNMTFGEVMDDMEAVLSEKPIPAWDSFVEWLNSRLGEDGIPVENANRITIKTCSCPDGDYETEVGMPSFTATNCVEFLENLEVAFSAALDHPASHYMSTTGGVAFVLNVYSVNDDGTETLTLAMAFTFRE